MDTLPAGLGVVIATLEPTGMFNDDVDCPRNSSGLSDSLIPSDVTKEQLEARLQADCLPYMRIATLLRHYIYRYFNVPELLKPDSHQQRTSPGHLGG